MAAFVAGCGTTSDGSDSASSGSGGCKAVSIAYLGAKTGDSANLGLNMVGGVKVAIDDYNKAHPDCKVTEKDFDSQGDPEKATPLATQIINDSSIVGVVGPGFSGESDATGKAFSEAGLVTISASATNPALTTNGWKTFHRVLGNDDTQAPADAKYITDTLKAKKVFVVDDASDYGKGLATGVKKSLGSLVGGTDEIQQKQTDFGPTVTKIKASGADTVFYGGYYAEAGLIAKQLRAAGYKGYFVSGDGSLDPGFVKAAGSTGAEDARLSCPCGPASADFTTKYKADNNGKEPGTYSAEAYDAAKVLLDGIAAGKTTRPDELAFVNSYDQPGLTKQIKFTPTGEVTDAVVYAYTVKDGKIGDATVIK
ncbi:MAG: branched-chain amino acid ABC transporter substrate-binding protein [Solirubrobacteraceae bacterium]|nr:branched-chain amino acid ABC transporter substrate-binding protein [Patulibacter sp.]